jgi:hypothetical protein
LLAPPVGDNIGAMSRHRRPTEHIQHLVKQSRVRVVLPIQALLIVAAAGLVWGWLGGSQPVVAFGIIGFLVFAETVLLLLFLRQPAESDEAGVTPISDTPDELVLSDPAGGTLTYNRRAQELCARQNTVRIRVSDVQSVMVEAGADTRLMVGLTRDLVVLSEIVACASDDRRRMVALGRYLARATAVPFEEG